METVGLLLRASAAGRDAGRVAEPFDRVEVPAALAYTLGLDPTRDGTAEPAELPAGRIVVLAGPGVVASRNIEGLRALATAANVPVANTWGAKGVFPWDSPHHMGTCGLQARDFELLGFEQYDAIVATGVDLAESPHERFALAPVVEIAPGELERLAQRVTPVAGPIPSTTSTPGFRRSRSRGSSTTACRCILRGLSPIFAPPLPPAAW